MASREFVIGDLHGCADELEVLLDALQPSQVDTLVFLGDYIDRGPNSAGVVERLLRLREEGVRCVFLKGNHEDMFLDFLGLGGHYGDAFLFNGGYATLDSYGVQRSAGTELAQQLPAAHRQFFLGLQLTYTTGNFLCVHAGINPLLPLEEQREEELLWIREEFLRCPHRLGRIVLFGHTPQREVFVDLPYKIGLDTGLVYGNKLSCLELGEKELWQVERGGRKAKRRSLAEEFARAGQGAGPQPRAVPER